MSLDPTQFATREANRRNALSFTPSAATMHLAKKRAHLHTGASGNGVDVLDVTDDLERHGVILIENLLIGKAQLIRRGAAHDKSQLTCRQDSISAGAGLGRFGK